MREREGGRLVQTPVVVVLDLIGKVVLLSCILLVILEPGVGEPRRQGAARSLTDLPAAGVRGARLVGGASIRRTVPVAA